jgi:hypothetical protein
MLDSANWTNFKDSNYALDAVGGPTIEMWVASWNAKGYTALETEINSTGYYIGKEGEDLAGIADNWDETAGGYYIDLSSDTAGYGDELYYPHQEPVDDENCYGYIDHPEIFEEIYK